MDSMLPATRSWNKSWFVLVELLIVESAIMSGLHLKDLVVIRTRWAFLLPIQAEGTRMCEERQALLRRYNALALEHAQHVSDLGELADQSLANDSLRDQLERALIEIDRSRQAVQEARQQLKQHTIDHCCEQFPGLDE